MKPAPFDYFAPHTIDEALSLLQEHDDSKVLAGGQSLLPMMNLRLAAPAVLIDLNRVDEMSFVRHEENALTIGAMTRHRQLEGLNVPNSSRSILAEGVALIGHAVIRNQGTIGGSLAHADPAAEWAAIFLALDGVCAVEAASSVREIQAEDLFEGFFTTTIANDELITEVRLDLPTGRVGSCFLELARRHGDFALVGLGAVLGLSESGVVSHARLALAGVASTPMRAAEAEAQLLGHAPSQDVFRATAEVVGASTDPVSDIHGSSGYRRELAKVLTMRALEVAAGRAQRGD